MTKLEEAYSVWIKFSNGDETKIRATDSRTVGDEIVYVNSLTDEVTMVNKNFVSAITTSWPNAVEEVLEALGGM